MLVDYQVRIEPPKSRNGKRTLPLDDELYRLSTELRKRQARESGDRQDASTALASETLTGTPRETSAW